MTLFLMILAAYASGSVPYGLILSKIFLNVDVRKIGSGNIGTTNVLRTGHKGLAAATLLCDALKGILPVCIVRLMDFDDLGILSVAFAAILGHIFPVWLKFQGGKGVATALGVFAVLSIPLGIFTATVWLLAACIGQISSLSALCAFALSPLFAALVLSWPLAIFSLAVALLIFWTHRSNIRRLMAGQEKGMG
jgi:glycerol-3-phosphate acyltransferase PlsY